MTDIKEITMAGKSISAWVDDRTARSVERLAKVEARPPAHVVAAAVKFCLSLPEEALSAIRKIEAFGTEREVQWAMRKVARALLEAQYEIAADRAAGQMRADKVGSEAEIDAAVVRATKGGKGSRVG
jgi:hypothetical protein